MSVITGSTSQDMFSAYKLRDGATTASESASRFASLETPKHLGADGPDVGAGYSFCPPPGILELGLANVRGLETLGTACHLELHLVTFRQTLEALRGDGAEVDEDVLAALLRDEAEALRIVEPLDSTVCHDSNLSFGANPGCLVFRSPKVLPRETRGQTKTPRELDPRAAYVSLLSLRTSYQTLSDQNQFPVSHTQHLRSIDPARSAIRRP